MVLPPHTTLDCGKRGEERQCGLYCVPPYTFISPPANVYTCGPTTNFSWSDGARFGDDVVLPGCTGEIINKFTKKADMYIMINGCITVLETLKQNGTKFKSLTFMVLGSQPMLGPPQGF